MRQLQIAEFFNECLAAGFKSVEYKPGCDIIDLTQSNLKIKTKGCKFVPIRCVSRHKTDKHLIKLTITAKQINTHVIVTTDHVCMIYDKDHFFENRAAKDIRLYDFVSVCTKDNSEIFGEIVKIDDLGSANDYVYDIEVLDDGHVFYANDVLIHNSLFLNLKCITDKIRQEQQNLPLKLHDWPDDNKMQLWNDVENFVTSNVTQHVRQLLVTECFCEDASMLSYELEYIAASSIIQAKKNYAMYKMIAEGPVFVDDIKYVGLELRKATLPAAIKDALAEIYKNVLAQNWTESDFRAYINQLYDEFKTLSIQDIAQWKGYSTPKLRTGFLQLEKGSTGIAKAVQYYNDLIDKLGVGKKYEEIMLNEKVRFVYLIPNNKYGIKCIAFKDNVWPDEFNEIFQVDYTTMFDKCVISPLKNFMVAAKFSAINPSQQLLFDIFGEL